MSRILVTGGRGFIGRALVPVLRAQGHEVVVTSRDSGDGSTVKTGPLDGNTDWAPALTGIDAVVHLAARVHVMADTAADPLAEFRCANTAATRRLAEQAAGAGVKRFVYLSSIKVNGEATPGAPFSEADVPAPVDPYGVSKWEAEQALAAVAASSALEPIILRPPLVYGPGVKGNFLSLIRAVAKGWPLPLGCARAKRSLVYVGNLADAIARAVSAPNAAGTYLIADGEAPSVAALIRAIGEALGRPARLLAVPPFLLRLGGRLTGQAAAVGRLLDSLCVDDRQLRKTLNWQPPFTLAEGLAETARWYRTTPAAANKKDLGR